MDKNIQKKITDISGVELTPGEPTACLGNGEQGLDCCCDECDYFLYCFPKSDLPNFRDDHKGFVTQKKD